MSVIATCECCGNPIVSDVFMACETCGEPFAYDEEHRVWFPFMGRGPSETPKGYVLTPLDVAGP